MHLSTWATFSVVLVIETHGMILKDTRVLSMRVWPSQDDIHMSREGMTINEDGIHMCFQLGLQNRVITPIWLFSTGALERPWDLGDKASSAHTVLSWYPLLEGRTGHEQCPSEALHKAAWEEACAAIPLQSPLEPAVFMFLVYKDDITFL